MITPKLIYRRCNCGYPAAQVPSLWLYLFRTDKARRIAAAAISGKCVPCYQIDLVIAECVKRPLKDWAKS